MPLLEVRNLTKVFGLDESPFGGRRSGEVRAVDDVSLDIHQGETLGLVGESGSGKSTLGRLILRLIEPTSGAILFDGIDLLQANGSELRRLRRDMQIIFQDPFGSLDPRFRVQDVIAEPLLLHREALSRDTRRQRVRELLRAVGMDESAMPRYPHEFSGGQRQRIGIARALALRPKFIVADEPISSLDVSVGAQIVNLLQQLQRDFGLTYLFISHSMPVVRYLSTRIAVMYRVRSSRSVARNRSPLNRSTLTRANCWRRRRRWRHRKYCVASSASCCPFAGRKLQSPPVQGEPMATNPSAPSQPTQPPQLLQGPAPLSEGQRILDTFFAPSKTFTDLRRSASWWAPFLIIAIVGLLFVYVVDQKVGFRKVSENLIQLQPKQADRIDRLPADQRERVMQQQATITRIISYAVPVIALGVYAIFAGVLFATLKFGASAEVKYKTLFALVVYSRLPELLMSLLATLSLLAGVSGDAFNIQNPVATNPGYFIGPDGSPALRTLLTSLDVFTIWTLILTAIGITCISKVKRGTAFAVVFGWFAVVVLVRVALAAATS